MIRTVLLATAALAVTTTAQAAAPAGKKANATTTATLPASNPFAQPSTLTELARVSGVGEAKLARYGEAMLAALAAAG